MKHDNVNRRDFSKWTMAAFGGFMSGTVIGCTGSETGAPTEVSGNTPAPAGDDEKSPHPAHACRGLNECATASNECRGQGSCATEAWHHACGGQNECKGQGGCGNAPLTNDCKTKGNCHIPLMDAAWETARKNMEQKWTDSELKYGEPPAPKS